MTAALFSLDRLSATGVPALGAFNQIDLQDVLRIGRMTHGSRRHAWAKRQRCKPSSNIAVTDPTLGMAQSGSAPALGSRRSDPEQQIAGRQLQFA